MKMRNDPISRKIKRVIAILLAIVLGYFLLTAASIISFSEKDETRPADAAIVLGASVYDNSPSPVFCERINHAVDLYNEGYVETIIMTGGVGEETSGQKQILPANTQNSRGSPLSRYMLKKSPGSQMRISGMQSVS